MKLLEDCAKIMSTRAGILRGRRPRCPNCGRTMQPVALASDRRWRCPRCGFRKGIIQRERHYLDRQKAESNGNKS